MSVFDTIGMKEGHFVYVCLESDFFFLNESLYALLCFQEIIMQEILINWIMLKTQSLYRSMAHRNS